MELAGYVHQVGDESISMLAGQPVMGIVTPRRPDRGAQAQYVCLPAASLCPLPDDMDLVDAATIPMNGVTAKMAVESLEASPGDTVLITGGAGALGGYSIQLAKVAGLYVIADAKESDRELLVALGADEIVPRDEGRAAALRAEHPNGVDGLIDAARVGPPAAELVRDGGVVVAVRTSDEIVDPRVRPRYVSVEEQLTNTDALAWLLEQVRAGRLTPRVAVRLPLAEAAEAHRLVERGGLRGRVVLLLDDDRTVDGTGPQTRPEFD
jgi:NADPH:quinone reductase-like Zn-dependent oxidoreductase